MTLAAPAAIDSDSMVARAKASLEGGRLADAVGLCAAILEVEPDKREAYYVAAIAERYQRHYDKALRLTETLIALDPTYGRAYQERGHCLREMGDMPAALASYQQAVGHNMALVASWKSIAELHIAAGRVEADFGL